MEFWDLLDENRKSLGRTHERGKEKKAGEYHIVVCIVTVDYEGRLLVTQRDVEKEICPKEWEITAGSVLSGETSLQGAMRELKEETGIIAQEKDMILIDQQRSASAFWDTYLVKKDSAHTNIILQKGETMDSKWVTLKEFDEMAESGLMAKPVVERFAMYREKVKKQGGAK